MENAAARRLLRPGHQSSDNQKGILMLEWAAIFFVISLVAGFFGFSGVSSGARSVAKILFFVAIAIFLVILIFGVFLGMLVF
jgi:uncharacterized membrane protein YtjA (UPF0391 family)